MTKDPKKLSPDEKAPDQQPMENTNAFLHTEKKHKDWYNQGRMGNLGDKRGYLPKEEKKPKK